MGDGAPAGGGVRWRRLLALAGADAAGLDPATLRTVRTGRGGGFAPLVSTGTAALGTAVAAGLHHAAATGDPTARERLHRTAADHLRAEGIVVTPAPAPGGALTAARAAMGPRRTRAGGDARVDALAAAVWLDGPDAAGPPGDWAALDRLATAAGLVPAPPPLRPLEPSAADPTPALHAPPEVPVPVGSDDLATAAAVGDRMLAATTWSWAVRACRSPGPLRGAPAAAVAAQRCDERRLANVGLRHRLGPAGATPAVQLRVWVGSVALAHGRRTGAALVSELLALDPVSP